jgi:exodeoxyribonuclease III
MLVVWAQRSPTYVRAVMKGLDAYADFVRAAPCVVIGDFNSHWRWDRRDGATNHSALVDRMKKEFGLLSALHATAPPSAPEPPTQYWRWKKEYPYHLDYAFIPADWVPRVKSVEIGNYGPWADESDHRPLSLDLGDDPLT